ncbi:nucleolus and neural progenitor protein isoform X1 [Misgurnus anguillicaudatus]|uniref:nucleolus and neural progenitor protein isoform X1 n=1 Tax=Misgurnus anguillicaudatus TaxID=75329 RepID=UPI003CCF6C7E
MSHNELVGHVGYAVYVPLRAMTRSFEQASDWLVGAPRQTTVNMAQEPWNKVHIPFPSAMSSCRVEFTDSTGVLMECLLADCEKVLTLLRSEVLQTEIRVLYELLYVLNNSFRQHKPFRALKQVEQCINRLKEMNLQAAIEDLKELCPKNIQREAGTEVGECDVPSQPMLEWLCLKLLGASSLLARTLERCMQAFLRTRQHLQLAEFIVLNVVITSMLSRLWVFFRGILRVLIPMYSRTTELIKNVAQSKPMAYLTDFTLPGDLKDFLFLSYPDLLMEDDSTKPSWPSRRNKKSQFSALTRLFGDTEEEEKGEKDTEIQVFASGHYKGFNMDLGTAISQQRPEISSCGLDIKAMLQQPCKTTKQIVSHEQRLKLSISSQAGLCQKRKFLNSVRKVSSFRNMTAQLKEVIHWCKSYKFHQERKRLSFLFLKCLRMESLEADSIRVEKRLKTFKVKVQKALMLQKNSSTFAPFQRSRWHHRTSIRSFMAHYRTCRRGSMCVKMSSKTVKDLFGMSLKNKRNCRPVDQNKEVSGHNEAPTHEEEKLQSQTVMQKPINLNKDDIDDIFASIGF